MKICHRAFLICMLTVFMLLFPFLASAGNIRVVQIWDDQNDLDGSRPEHARVYVSDGKQMTEVMDQDYHEYPETSYEKSRG